MLQKDLVGTYLTTNFTTIEEARKLNGFSWRPILRKLLELYPDIGLDPENEVHRDRVRNNFLNIRRRRRLEVKLDLTGINTNIEKPRYTGEELTKAAMEEFILSSIPRERPFCETYKAPRRLIFDVETSPNLVFSWNIGRRCNISAENIVKERSIICIAWRWVGEKETHALSWNLGDDREMLIEFAKVMNSADELITFNGDNFDIRWVRARCLYHGIKVAPRFNSIDVLKLARKQFRLNSNKLAYISAYLGVGAKVETGGFDLWKKVCLTNDQEALELMVTYCKGDIELLESVYNIVKEYSPNHKFRLIPNKISSN